MQDTETNVQEPTQSVMGIVADIVAAYVGNNAISADAVPGLISATHAAVMGLAAPQAATVVEEPKEPAVPVRKSITNDFIICLEDGQKFKSLKRHLRTKYNLSPEEYRAKWGLPSDYPMVAPSYSAARSALAREMGLGQKTQGSRGGRKPRKATAPAASNA